MKKQIYLFHPVRGGLPIKYSFSKILLFNNHNISSKMKRFTLLCIFLCATFFAAQAQLKLGNNVNTVNPDAILEMEITAQNKGVLLPRVTTGTRPAATAANTGMFVYNVTTSSIQYCDGTQWKDLNTTTGGGGIYGGSGTTPSNTAVTLTNTLNFDANTLYIDGTNDRVGIGTNGPTTPLDVNGVGRFREQADGAGEGGEIRLEDAGDTEFWLIDQNNNTNPRMRFVHNTELMSILENGKVGIGVSAPTYRLDVNGAIRSRPENVAAKEGGNIYIEDYDNASQWIIDQYGNVGSDRLRVIYNGGGEWLSILEGGSVGIGNSAPSEKLEVAGGVRINERGPAGQGGSILIDDSEDAETWLIQQFSNSGNPRLRFVHGGAERLTLDENGQLGVSTPIPDQALSVNGNASKNAGGTAWAVFSDPRIKKNIHPMQLGLATLEKINPIYFQYDETKVNDLGKSSMNKTYIGVNAEEIYNIPELRDYLIEIKNKYGIKDLKQYVNSDALMYITINAVKELKADLTDLEAENAALKAQLSEMQTLKAEVASIKAMLSNTPASQQSAASATGKE